jgi:hypothetical protein
MVNPFGPVLKLSAWAGIADRARRPVVAMIEALMWDDFMRMVCATVFVVVMLLMGSQWQFG